MVGDATELNPAALALATGKIQRQGPVANTVAYHRMTDDEVWAFLAALPAHTGKLATTRADGGPHVAPIWYAVDGASLIFMTDRNTLKGRNLQRDPRAALCVDDERPPFSFVVVEGVVDISDDREAQRHWATVIGGRYMGADKADEYGVRNGVPGELVIRLQPSKIASAADLAD